jgi:quinol monooxygenase YgiN
MSLRHIVMWKLRDFGDAVRFKALLDSCADVVPGMLVFAVAVRSEGLEASADVVLDSTFVDQAALAAYQGHPHHKAVAAQLGEMRIERHVFDWLVS